MAARNAAECGTRSERDFGPVDRCRGHQWRGSRAEWRTQNIATEGRNSPQIARLEPARFRDRTVPVAHKRIGPARDCQFMLRVLAFSDKAVTRSVIASRG